MMRMEVCGLYRLVANALSIATLVSCAIYLTVREGGRVRDGGMLVERATVYTPDYCTNQCIRKVVFASEDLVGIPSVEPWHSSKSMPGCL